MHWHMYICTLTRSHALYLAALIMVSLEVSEEVQRNHFSFKKIFFSSLLSPAGSFVIIITGLILVSHFFTIAVLASSSHHLIFLRSFFFLRWWRSLISHVDTVANPEFPQSASITESSGDAIKYFPWFTLLSLLRFVVIHGVWINVDELYNFLWDRYKNTSMGSLQHRAHTYW